MSRLHRVAWLTIALMFVVTSVGVGAYAFWVNSRSDKTKSPNLISCSKGDKPPDQQPVDGKVKGAKLADYKPPQKFSYVKCIDYKIGTGASVQADSTVTVMYVGALASNGVIFDSSIDTTQPLTIGLSQVIPGWSDGLQGMKTGGVRRIFIPSQYGYGNQGGGDIPANSDLVFDVQLIFVQ